MRSRMLLTSLVCLTLAVGCAPKRTRVDTSRSPQVTMKRVAGEVERGCAAELKEFCALVTPGQQRLLACLYAYSDQLSSQCEYALFDAAAELEREVAALSYVANECDADLDRFCSGVALGEGRLLHCLDEHARKLSPRCTAALDETKL